MRSKVSNIYILLSKNDNGMVIQSLLDIIADLVEDEDMDNKLYEEILDILNDNEIKYEE